MSFSRYRFLQRKSYNWTIEEGPCDFLEATGAGIQRLEQSPLVALSAAQLTKFLIDASAEIRAEDRQALQQYRDTMARSIGQIDAITDRGQAAEVQVRWLIWIGIGCFVFGILFWSIFSGAVARALPERWHVPEWMAVRAMAMDYRSAGDKLVAISNSETSDVRHREPQAHQPEN